MLKLDLILVRRKGPFGPSKGLEVPSHFRGLVGRHTLFYRAHSDGAVLVVRMLHAVILPELHLPSLAEDDMVEDRQLAGDVNLRGVAAMLLRYELGDRDRLGTGPSLAIA